MFARIRCIVALVVSVAVSACHSTGTSQRATPVSDARPLADATDWAPVTRLLVDSAGARMAALELQRLALDAAGAVHTPEAETVRRQIAALDRQVAEVPHSDVAARLVAAQVLRAFDAREAGLLVERRQLLVSYTAASPRVQRVDAEARSLDQRRAQLQARVESAERGR